MFWTEEKLSNRIEELEAYRYRNKLPIFEFQCQEDPEGEVGKRPPEDGLWSTMKAGEHWTGRDLYLWLKTDIKIPESWKGQPVVGLFNFGQGEGGNNSEFESLLYVDGSTYQGVDSRHPEVFLPNDCYGRTLQLIFRLWSGLEGGGEPKEQEHRINRAEVACFDEATDDLYFTAMAVIETVKVLNENQPERQSLLIALDRAFLQIDWSEPASDVFYQTVRQARDQLRTEIKQMKKHSPITIRAIGHTHIDVAWLWRLKHTREKAARSFSTVFRLMEKFPEYTFLQTQPQLYDYIKSDYPEVYGQIKERINEGRWEADGGMWLEADCNIPSGESLVRQLLMCTRFLRDEFGVECHYLWLPDVFGYSWALPQILKKSGIDTFMTTKISWNQYNRMPHDTFKWRGMDGSEILTHFITTTDEDEEWSETYTYNGHILPKTVKGSWDVYRDKSMNQELLLSYGYGDGGGGVTREMLEMRRRLNEIPGLPNVETGRADDYFNRLHETVENTDQYVHTWDGELYLEYHRGTYTSHAYNKKMNRYLELLYRETEWMNVLDSIIHSDWSHYSQSGLNEGWKIILRNQFHDIIPGSAIREVYEDSRLEYKKAKELALASRSQLLENMISESQEHTYTVFNSAPWERSDYVLIPAVTGMESGAWYNEQNQKIEAHCTGKDWLVYVDAVPSMGMSAIIFRPAETEEKYDDAFEIHRNGLSTLYYDIQWNESGQLVKIYDKKAERHVLENGIKGNVLQVFEDKPMAFDAWDIDIYYQEKMREVSDLTEVTVKETNPLRTVVQFKWQYMNSVIEQEMIVYANLPRIDFVTKVDWHEQHQLLKTAFPVTVRSTEATYDIQFGNVTRPTHWNTSWDLARFETVGHQWADLSERGYGVSILNDCKYGHDIKNNVIRLSLIKSATDPDYKQDQGEHEFTYSLLPHEGDWVTGHTVQHAWELNNPLVCEKGNVENAGFSLFYFSADNVMVDAVKKSEDEKKVILRLHEYTGQRGHVKAQSDCTIQSWQECNLMEQPGGDVFYEEAMQFHMNPYEIKTFLVEF